MTIIEGWEVSPDRINMFGELSHSYPVGDAIITTKCVLDSDNGFLIVSDNGFAWKLKAGYSQAMGPVWKRMQSGKTKWVRWCDVANIKPTKNGQVLIFLKIRKKGLLKVDKKGNPKLKKWKLTMRRNKNEPKPHFKQRLGSFNNIMVDIFNRNKVEVNPETSDSNM
ncbi:MAG: hypothetical protein ACFFCM_20895 [Promethearchaeota archaeon]